MTDRYLAVQSIKRTKELGAAAGLWRDLDDERDTLVSGNIEGHTIHPDIGRSRRALERAAAQSNHARRAAHNEFAHHGQTFQENIKA